MTDRELAIEHLRATHAMFPDYWPTESEIEAAIESRKHPRRVTLYEMTVEEKWKWFYHPDTDHEFWNKLRRMK